MLRRLEEKKKRYLQFRAEAQCSYFLVLVNVGISLPSCLAIDRRGRRRIACPPRLSREYCRTGVAGDGGYLFAGTYVVVVGEVSIAATRFRLNSIDAAARGLVTSQLRSRSPILPRRPRLMLRRIRRKENISRACVCVCVHIHAHILRLRYTIQLRVQRNPHLENRVQKIHANNSGCNERLSGKSRKSLFLENFFRKTRWMH